jgi:hypothetical protein
MEAYKEIFLIPLSVLTVVSMLVFILILTDFFSDKKEEKTRGIKTSARTTNPRRN